MPGRSEFSPGGQTENTKKASRSAQVPGNRKRNRRSSFTGRGTKEKKTSHGPTEMIPEKLKNRRRKGQSNVPTRKPDVIRSRARARTLAKEGKKPHTQKRKREGGPHLFKK